jgi:carboxypeptidase PM20D1
MPLWERVMVRNRWLFGPFLIHNLEATPNGNALVRTTTAVTMFNAGVKDNVLAAKAQAVINFRILPGDTSASVTEHIQRVIADDRVEISQFGADMREASPVSPVKGESYNILRSTVQGFFPDAVVTPNLLVATTDSSRYYALSDNVYKFFPMVRDAADMERIHGLNERLGVQDYLKSVRFMTQLMADESSQP